MGVRSARPRAARLLVTKLRRRPNRPGSFAAVSGQAAPAPGPAFLRRGAESAPRCEPRGPRGRARSRPGARPLPALACMHRAVPPRVRSLSQPVPLPRPSAGGPSSAWQSPPCACAEASAPSSPLPGGFHVALAPPRAEPLARGVAVVMHVLPPSRSGPSPHCPVQGCHRRGTPSNGKHADCRRRRRSLICRRCPGRRCDRPWPAWPAGFLNPRLAEAWVPGLQSHSAARGGAARSAGPARQLGDPAMQS